MKKTKILAIAPYKGMAELLAANAKDRDDIDLTIEYGNLAEGLQIAKAMTFYKNFDAIISRGGTAELIRKELSIPVIDVPLSVYDILRSIKTAESYGEKFAITGFSGITENAKILCDLLQLNITIITFRDESEVLPELLELKERQFTFVICDQISFMTAQEIGLNSIVVPSGNESIRTALDDAVRSVQSIRKANKLSSLFKTALLNIDGTTLIYDSTGELLFSSLMGTPFESLLKTEIQDNLPDLLNSNHISVERKIDNKLVKITTSSLHIEEDTFTVFRILEKTSCFEDAKNPITVFNEFLEHENPDFSKANSANLIGNTHMLLEKYAPSALPVLIVGEKGTGKAKAAQLIYRLGPYHTRPYYVIDCSLLNDKKLNVLLESDSSPLAEANTTIHLKEINYLNDTQFLKLYSYIKDSNLCKRNRVIFSSVSEEGNTRFQNRLANELSCLLLPIAPLRERTNDISGIATIYLSQLNVQLGKQIIGFHPDALELIKKYHWPNNLDQFRRVIKELSVITNTSYISAQDVTSVLEQENLQFSPKELVSSTPALDLDQPLDKITRDIINIVLVKEGMNRENTAKHLGISRSTLWRILKNQS